MTPAADLRAIADRILRAHLADDGHGLETAADCRPLLADVYLVITGLCLPEAERRKPLPWGIHGRRVGTDRRIPNQYGRRVGPKDRRSVKDLSARIQAILEAHEDTIGRLGALQRAAVSRAADRVRRLPDPLEDGAIERIMVDELGVW